MITGDAMRFARKIEPGSQVNLRKFDPSADGGLDREEGQKIFAELSAKLDRIQEELFAASTHSLLIVFQAPDTGGKDGAIRRVLDSFNVQGVRVESFKVPTPEELAHDFLWRVHKVTPAKGLVGVFNRSHYEDVLVVRVHALAPESVWRARYNQINEFEGLLASYNTIILKFFLHISKEEQEQRLLEREQEAIKSWKLSAGDWKEREYWDEYMNAYEDALSRCSTKHAPWYVIPANKKWFRDVAIAEALEAELSAYRSGWESAMEETGRKRKAELEEYRKSINMRAETR
jgi:PPK2 family polyphosphate:nucleotide phosphotransferase